MCLLFGDQRGQLEGGRLTPRLVDSNPFVEVATHFFLEDLADKVGISGLNNYLIGLAKTLAGNMPEEEWKDWSEFLQALHSGDTMLSAFEKIFTVTEYCIVTEQSPFERGWREYVKRVGRFSSAHNEVADFYNKNVKPTAVNSLHIILQTFREAAASRVKVAKKRVRYAQLATVWPDGQRMVASGDDGKKILKISGISEIKLRMLLRDNSDVWVLWTE